MIIRSFAIALAATAIPLAVHAQETPATTGGAVQGTDVQATQGQGVQGQAQSPSTGATGTTSQPHVTGNTGGTGTGMNPGQNDAAMQQQRPGTATTGQPTPNQAAHAGQQSSGPFVTIPDTGAWRLADFEGTAVYGAAGEHIGEINDVLVGPDGEVAAIIIGVGGFLGIGEKDVAVSMNALQFGPGDGVHGGAAGYGTSPGTVGTGTTGTGTPGIAAAPEVGAAGSVAVERNQGRDPGLAGQTAQQPGTVAPVIGEDGLPDRVILSVTREQLEEAPEFEGVRSPYQQG